MFDNVKKLTKYKWGGEFFNSLKPSQNEITIPDSTSKNIKKGSKFLFIYVIITFLISISTILFVTNLYGRWLNYAGNSWKTQIIVRGLITAVISGAIVYAVMTYFTGNKKRKPLPYFVLFCLSAVGIVYLIWGIIGGLLMLAWSIVGGLLTILGSFVSVIAYSDVAVGCVDFLLEANKKVPEEPKKEE